MNLIPNAAALGLTEKEAEIYELLLNLGELDAARIIGETQLKRPTVYKSLYTLEQKGLIKQRKTKETTVFRPETPQKLLEVTQSQFASLERARSDLQAVIPMLTSAYLFSTERPVVTTFEGVNGLKKIYEDMLTEKAPIFAVLQTAAVEPALFDWLITDFTQRRIAAEIPVKSVVADVTWSDEYAKRSAAELREVRLVPNDKFPFQHEIDIYGQKVAFINFRKDEQLIGVVINHPKIAQTMKAWFDLAWEAAERY